MDRGATWSVAQPIVLDGERIGAFRLEADYAGPRTALQRRFLGVTAAVLGGSIVLVALLAMRLQEFIARPIQRLAAASQAVARDHDYSVRVQSPGRDELGRLTGAFNHMLARIQAQDAALLAARRELQSKVAALESEIIERQRAEAAQARLTAILEATPDFVGSMDLTGRTIYLNQGGRRMIGRNGHGDEAPLELADYHPAWAGQLVLAEGLPGATRRGTWTGDTALRHADGREIHVSQVVIAHRNTAGEVDYFSTVMRDVSERKAAEARLAELNNQLVDASRQAGMAEVATGVLHNVGNVLNSVNISASTVIEKLRASKVDGFAKATALLAAHECRSGRFPDHGRPGPAPARLPAPISAGFLVEENSAMRGELEQLGSNIEHIKEIVAMQQTYARATGVLEDVPVDKLIEDAVQLNLVSFKRHGIDVVREVPAAPVPPVRVDKHKVLQILINLLRNAKHALEDARRPDLRLGIALEHVGDTVRIVVSDNGIGIAPENLTSVFRHGFTTEEERPRLRPPQRRQRGPRDGRPAHRLQRRTRPGRHLYPRAARGPGGTQQTMTLRRSPRSAQSPHPDHRRQSVHPRRFPEGALRHGKRRAGGVAGGRRGALRRGGEAGCPGRGVCARLRLPGPGGTGSRAPRRAGRRAVCAGVCGRADAPGLGRHRDDRAASGKSFPSSRS